MGLLSALHGAGEAAERVGMMWSQSVIDEAKQRRIMELQGSQRAAEQERGGEIQRKNAEAQYNLENRDRGIIAGRLATYAGGREETLPDDQAGPVGRVTPNEGSIAERGAREAMALGRPDIGAQYQNIRNSDMTDAMKVEAAHKNAITLKGAKPGESDSDVTYKGKVGEYYDSKRREVDRAPEREDRTIGRLERRDEDNNRRTTGNNLVTGGINLRKEADTMEKNFAKTYEFGIPKDDAGKAQYMADKAEIQRTRQQGLRMIEQGQGMLNGGNGDSPAPRGQPREPNQAINARMLENRDNPTARAEYTRLFGKEKLDKLLGGGAGKPVPVAPRTAELTLPPGAMPEAPPRSATELPTPGSGRRGILSQAMRQGYSTRDIEDLQRENDRLRNNATTVY